MDEAPDPRVLIISLGGAQLFVGQRWHDPKSLATLFDLEGHENELVLMDKDGEEAPLVENSFVLSPESHYTIVTEQDIDAEEEKTWTLEERGAHIMKVDELRKKFLSEHWSPKHLWLFTDHPEILDPTFLTAVCLFSFLFSVSTFFSFLFFFFHFFSFFFTCFGESRERSRLKIRTIWGFNYRIPSMLIRNIFFKIKN